MFAQNKEIREMVQNNFIMLNLMVQDHYNVFLIPQFNRKFESLLFYISKIKELKELADIECYMEL